MPPQIPSDLMPRVRQIILPLVSSDDDREALLTEAFYLHDPLLYGIGREGAAKVFAIRCIRKLLDHGCLTVGEHSLARLLATARYDCGVEKHDEIDTLVQIVNALCGQPAPAKPASTAPVQAPTTPTQTLGTPTDERTPTVFISYSHKDTEFAQKLIADLNSSGHACWIDTSEIKGGDEWIMTISEGIINSYAFVPIVTLKALQSKWVQDEILWARQKNKLIIPVILENVLGETRFFPLVSYQGVTLFDSDYADALPKLLSYLPNLATSESEDPIDDTDTEDPLETITVSTLRTVPRKLELAYMERLRLEELLNTEKYTAMGGTSEVRQQNVEMRAVFELLPMKRDHDEAPQDKRTFENAIDEIQTIRRCVLLGEPGGGKTTTLWKLASDLVDTALKDRSAPIPALIRLGKWTNADQSLSAFIASQLGDLGAYLDVLLREKRVALLLDGLNELPTSQRNAKYPQVKKLIEEHADLLAVVSCRELDYTIDLGFDKVNITPLDPIRIREFAGRYLGDEAGDDLFWKLAGENAHQQHKNFMEEFANQLAQSEQVFWLNDHLPEGVHWTYDWDKEKKYSPYWEQWLAEREKPSGLMVLARNPYMLLMLTSVYADEGELPDNRGQLFAKFVDILLEREVKSGVMTNEEVDPLINDLLGVAYKMQMRPIADDDANALTVLSEVEVLEIMSERHLYLAGSASILSIGDQIRFTHQLLQEYFAAKYMDVSIFDADNRVPLLATDIWSPESWWERTNWEEATILLAGLYSNDPTPVVEWLMYAQPEVAMQCITRSGANYPPDQTLLKLREAWIPRLTALTPSPSPNGRGEIHDPDPQARAAVGRALGKLRLSAGEPLDNRSGVTIQIAKGVQLPDIDWVTIPAGEFTYQEGTMTLVYDFQIARYPVTYAQFQAFIDDPEGFHDPRWWEGLATPDGHTDAPGDQAFKYWNHPRERVSWYDAMAFCRWLSWRLGGGYALDNIAAWHVRLPTEFEWERAARGTDGREYPYVGEFDPAKDNTRVTGIGQTSAVGIFPNGATPEGVLDMSGNVWDWCLTEYDNPQEQAMDEDIRSNARRVLRGGSWSYLRGLARAASRNFSNPDDRYNGYGFRLLCVRAPSL